MENLKNSSVNIPNTDENDPRIGQLMETNISKEGQPKAVIVGFPSDKGVAINGGRPGAAEAPNSIREKLFKMTPSAEYHDAFVDLITRSKDVGNLNVGHNLAQDQQNLGEVIASYLKQDIVPIILGGGHETAFAHFLGYAGAGLKTSIFNLDAHTDVRPLKEGQPHSGSSFRQALKHQSDCGETYLVGGLQPHSVAQSHLEFIDQHDGHYLFRDETNVTSISGLFHQHESEHLMVTFDMDAVDQSQAPGVSAPCTNGLPADLWLMAAYMAGRNEQVSSFDLSELNPKYDRDGQTAGLAALTIWNFLLGLSQR